MRPALIRLFAPAALLLAAAAPTPTPDDGARLRRDTLQDAGLRSTELLTEFRQRDFSPLWLRTDNGSVLGFIGPDYRRLRLKLLTARRDPANPLRYLVTGKSLVSGTVCAFSGELLLRQVREWKTLAPGLDNEPTPARRGGVALLDYVLTETPGQPHAGTFRGVACTRWFVDAQNRLRYDDIHSYADGFCNNQFAGTWTSRQTGKTKRCNWGDYRIPYAGPLDMGAGEFSPAAAYRANGWQDYVQAFGAADSAPARQREARAWWR